MNKNTIKKFAIEARKKLIDSVTDKAGMLGITEKSCSEPITKGPDFEVYQTVAGTEVTLNKNQCEQRKKLVSQIESRGFEAVVEEVAYTWFNRICAIRFMEVNDYLPNRVRVLSSEKEGKMEPDLVTRAPDVDLNLTAQEKEEIINWKMSGTSEDTDKLYCKLFLKQCHQLHDILPGLFEADSDYMELLFGISYTNKDDVIYMLVNSETGIPENDFNMSALDEEGNPTGQVEIIGWLYQYYNTELKDDTFAKLKKNIKITKERIPAATQLFTPDWIVRYMVENSVGRIWIEHLRAVDPSTDEKVTAERFGWKYYLPEAEQEEAVNVKLAEIRTTYKDLKPTDITCIDPCMGSGHILIAMFDVLMDIYESTGYDKREAAFEIVEHNIHGLDIDQRAYQLAYFAVMMKARQYDRRFFSRDIQPHAYAIAESGHTDKDGKKHKNYDEYALEYFCDGNTKRKKAMDTIISELHDAKEYGSILTVTPQDWTALYDRFAEIKEDIHISREAALSGLLPLVQTAEALAQKYDVVVTNPPYMAVSNAGAKVNDYVKKNFPDSKADLFAVFIERCGQMAKKNGYQAMITQHAWMFLSSFEKLRGKILTNDIVNMAHLGARAFEEIGGEVVQTTSFVIRKSYVADYKGEYCRLIEPTSQQGKEDMFLAGDNQFVARQDDYRQIPGSPVAYWISGAMRNCYVEGSPFPGETKKGVLTGNDALFVRFWHEVNLPKIGFSCSSHADMVRSPKKWFPKTGGGTYRKWYGNIEDVVNLENDGAKIKATVPNYRLRDPVYYMREAITWTEVASGHFSCRYVPSGVLFGNGGPACFFQKNLHYTLGLLNSKVANSFLQAIAPTINFGPEQINRVPFLLDKECEIENFVRSNITISKADWDSFETSWDFQCHPLIQNCHGVDNEKGEEQAYIEDAYTEWEFDCNRRFNQLKANEEELNRIFIDIYSLQEELTPEVEDKDVTVRKADLGRDIRSFISYAVGCMFGRYSPYKEGLFYAGGEWDYNAYEDAAWIAKGKPEVLEFYKQTHFMPDEDNIIPICDDEYFADDIVGRFAEFVEEVYGADTLEENLDFIASALGNKGDTSRKVIRNYFLKDFYADHLKVYQKRPIYWLFDSGKQNGFKALIYMHRYQPDTIARIRTDYVHEQQARYRTAIVDLEQRIANVSTGERVKLNKKLTTLQAQDTEIRVYEEKIHHLADQMISIDLDDGVKKNYAIFQDVLAKIK